MGLNDIRTILGLTNASLRSALKSALLSHGIRAVNDASTMLDMHDQINQGHTDLIIASDKLGREDVVKLLREMRHQKLDAHPFAVVVLLLETRDEDKIREAIDAGVDDVLLMPISPSQLLDRIGVMTRNRKPFVVTYNYIGPDRRKETRADSNPAPSFAAPNPLALRGLMSGDETYFNGKIRDGVAVLKRFAAAVGARQMQWLADQIAAGAKDAKAPVKQTAAHAVRLINTGHDMGKHLSGEAARAHMPKIAEMISICHHVSVDPRAAKTESLNKLTELSRMVASALAVGAGGLAQPTLPSAAFASMASNASLMRAT